MNDDYITVFDMEFDVREFSHELHGVTLPPTMERADIELLYATMKRIQKFRKLIAELERTGRTDFVPFFADNLQWIESIYYGMLNSVGQHADTIAQFRRALNEHNAQMARYDIDALAG